MITAEERANIRRHAANPEPGTWSSEYLVVSLLDALEATERERDELAELIASNGPGTGKYCPEYIDSCPHAGTPAECFGQEAECWKLWAKNRAKRGIGE